MNKQISLRVKFCFCSYKSENVKIILIVDLVRIGRTAVVTCMYIVLVCLCVCVWEGGLKKIGFCIMHCILGGWYSKE